MGMLGRLGLGVFGPIILLRGDLKEEGLGVGWIGCM